MLKKCIIQALTKTSYIILYLQLLLDVMAMSSLNQMRGQLFSSGWPNSLWDIVLVPSDGVVLSLLNNKHHSYQLPFQTLQTRERFS